MERERDLRLARSSIPVPKDCFVKNLDCIVLLDGSHKEAHGKKRLEGGVHQSTLWDRSSWDILAMDTIELNPKRPKAPYVCYAPIHL